MTLGPRCLSHSFLQGLLQGLQVPSAAEKPLSGGRTKTREQRSPIRELSKVQLRHPAAVGPSREDSRWRRAREGRACAKRRGEKQRPSKLPQHGGGQGGALDPSSAHATAFIDRSVLCDRQGQAGGQAWCPPSGCSRMRGLLIRASDSPCAGARRRGDQAWGTTEAPERADPCPPMTQTAQSRGQSSMTE